VPRVTSCHLPHYIHMWGAYQKWIPLAHRGGARRGRRDLAQGTASNAIKDAYAALKPLLKSATSSSPSPSEQARAGSRGVAEAARARAPRRPCGRRRADQSRGAAHAQLADPNGARAGKYNVTITGGKGIVVGDRAEVTMNFDDTD
jgi:hypothetical protein